MQDLRDREAYLNSAAIAQQLCAHGEALDEVCSPILPDGELYFASSVSQLLWSVLAALSNKSTPSRVALFTCTSPVVVAICNRFAWPGRLVQVEEFGADPYSLQESVAEFNDSLRRTEVRPDIILVPTCHWLTGELLPESDLQGLLGAASTVILDSAQQFGTSLFTKDLRTRPTATVELFSMSKWTAVSSPTAFGLCHDAPAFLVDSLIAADPFGSFFPRSRPANWWLDNTCDSNRARATHQILTEMADEQWCADRCSVLLQNQEKIGRALTDASLDVLTYPRMNRAVVAFAIRTAGAAKVSKSLSEHGFQFSSYRQAGWSSMSATFFRLSCPLVPIGDDTLSSLVRAMRSALEG